jgi:hypothetical protein
MSKMAVIRRRSHDSRMQAELEAGSQACLQAGEQADRQTGRQAWILLMNLFKPTHPSDSLV